MSYIGNKPADTIATSADISDGAITAAKLASASVTQPKINGGVAGTGPAFSAYANASQTIATGTWTKVAVNTEEFDTNNYYDNVTNYRFTPLVAGYYQVSGQATITTAGSNAIVAVYKNGTSYKRGSMTSTNAFSSGNSLSALVFLNGSTDYIELYMIHNLGINATLSFGSDLCFFQATMTRAS